MIHLIYCRGHEREEKRWSRSCRPVIPKVGKFSGDWGVVVGCEDI